MKTKIIKKTMLGLTLGLGLSVAANAATFNVTTTSDVVDASLGNGICETAAGNGICTLRAAVQESNALAGIDTINLPAGTYILSHTGVAEELAVTGDLDVTESLAIVGAGMNSTIIDGGNGFLASPDRVFQLFVGDLNISGVTIRRGNAGVGHGGGVMMTGTSTLVIKDTKVTQNTAIGYAGAIGNMGSGTIEVTDCEISDNTATMGSGGALANAGGAVTITGSMLTDNTASVSGGALFNSVTASSISITDSTIQANEAQAGAGGAIEQLGSGDLSITRSYVENNTANGSAGGVYNSSSGVFSITESTISNNEAAGALTYGGGIQNNGGDLIISGSSISDNTAKHAGGIYNDGTGQFEITNSEISGNLANTGSVGAIFNIGTSELTIIDSRITENHAQTVGGLYSTATGAVMIDRTSFASNTATAAAGAIFHGGGDFTLTHSTLSNNMAGISVGGLYYASASPLTIENTTFSDNTAGVSAGALLNVGTNVANKLIHVTIFDNTAATGGGLYNAGPLTVSNSIIAGSSTGGSCFIATALTSGGHNLDSENSCGFALATDLVNTEPLLDVLADNAGPTLTHMPLDGSPAIDGGDNAGCTADDQRGFMRPVDGDDDGVADCDIGAVESNRCGDGVVETNSGEVCDDGNDSDADACLNTCVVATCGDGFVESGVEDCDNGAVNSDTLADACRLDCTAATCGDTVIDTGETCDDGNTAEGDGCSAGCTVEVPALDEEPEDAADADGVADGAEDVSAATGSASGCSLSTASPVHTTSSVVGMIAAVMILELACRVRQFVK